ncbi:hypothetical protein OAB85_03400 [Pseudomonadales bacterium]|nr:hypothetical protein [Pseudomonadales bacterium]MDB9797690.1 hypothetical protein [Pseudomonadales bacterium]
MAIVGLFGAGCNNRQLLVVFVGFLADIEGTHIRQIMIVLYASLSAACDVSLFGFVWLRK